MKLEKSSCILSLGAVILFITHLCLAQIKLGPQPLGTGDSKTWTGTHKDAADAPDSGIITKYLDGSTAITYHDGWITVIGKTETGEHVASTRDADGRLMEEDTLDVNGVLIAHYIRNGAFEDIYIYDSNHKLTNHIQYETSYDQQGRLINFTTMLLDSNNKMVGGEQFIREYADENDSSGKQTHKIYQPAKGQFLPDTSTTQNNPPPAEGTTPRLPGGNGILIRETTGTFTINGSGDPPQPEPGYKIKNSSDSSLDRTTFTLPDGSNVIVNLPDDISCGDTISGTVQVEPAGTNEPQRTKTLAELNGTVAIEVGGHQTNVSEKRFSCSIPAVATLAGRSVALLINGKKMATSRLPVSPVPLFIPTQFTLPTGGQQGRTLECGGNFAPTDTIKIGGTVLPEVASTPRKKIVRNTSEVVGPTTIECTHHGAVSQCPFRNLGIKLSAPKLNLLRGETTTLHVLVSGLAGINQPVPLDLVNNSPSVISISGGNVQHINIQPPTVQPNGTAAFDYTLNGIMPGGFGITGTVRWTDVCKPPRGN